MTAAERTAMYIANCESCLLSAAMKTCPFCRFNVGLKPAEPQTVTDSTRLAYGEAQDEETALWMQQDRDWRDLRQTEAWAL